MLRLAKNALQRSHDDLDSNLIAARTEITSLKSTVAQMAADASGIQCQLDATKVKDSLCYTSDCVALHL